MWVVLILIVLYLIYIGVSSRKKSPEELGEEGELLVANVLGRTVEGEQYVINDIIVVDKKGESSQIDHILINKFGIWVIETKHFSGVIYGDEDQKNWTQVLAYGKEKHSFYNPVKQNYTHIFRLKDALNDQFVPMHNVVVFTNAEDLIVDSDCVCFLSELNQTLCKEYSFTLDKNKMEKYYNKLKAIKENSTLKIGEHVEKINKTKNDIKNNICPRCGGQLVIREGKIGQFYGCSNYPNCKFTKSKEAN